MKSIELFCLIRHDLESQRISFFCRFFVSLYSSHLVCLLSQRGTGLSTPLTVSSLSQIMSARKLVEYLQHFRADNIIKDAEFIRSCIVPDSGTWTVLGQVYILPLIVYF